MKEIRGWFRRFIANFEKCRVPTVVENGGCFARLRDAEFFLRFKEAEDDGDDGDNGERA